MKRKNLITFIGTLFLVLVMVFAISACDNSDKNDANNQNNQNEQNGLTSDNRQVPVYQGMTVSNAVSTAKGVSWIVPLAAGGNEGDSGNHYGWYKDRDKDIDQDEPFGEDSDSIEEVIDSTLTVTGSAEKIYYAAQNQDIYITIHISNPDSFEILSFTLNGEKYSSYMFENGSNMENLILKVNVGNVSGLVEYTIDAIKYIDGTEIKDVLIDGDQTVEVGVNRPNQVYANVTETVGFNEIGLSVKISDSDGLIAYSKGALKAVIYDGETLTAEKDLKVGENDILFDKLTTGGLYEYAIVGYYDNFIDGFGMNVLYKKALYTNDIVVFENVDVTKDSVSFELAWHKDSKVKELSELVLLKDGEEIGQDIKAMEIDGLLSDNDYALVARYMNNGEVEEIGINFHTFAKEVPTMTLATDKVTSTGFDFEINITDPDHVGEITKIELLSGGDVKMEADTGTRAFFDLNSKTTYTVRVTYTYDLNDGTGAHTIVETAEVTTLLMEYTITYHLFEGENSAVNPTTYLEDSSVSLENATREEYTFMGWYLEDTFETKVTEIASDTNRNLDLYAKWAYGTEGLQYELIDESYSVSGYTGTSARVVIPEEWDGISVCSINERAFALNLTVEEIVFPDSLTFIGEYAFSGCDKLTSIELPDGMTSINERVFYFCSGLTSIVLPDSVTSIGSYAFYGCTNLTSIELPEGLISIGDYSFYGCGSLTSIEIPNTVISIGSYAFAYCIRITGTMKLDGVTYVGDYAFSHCTGIETLYWDSVYDSFNLIFSDCTGLKTLVFGDKVRSIPSYAFWGYANLESVSFGKNSQLTSIGFGAFQGCYNLTSIELPDSVTEIGGAAFQNCYSLTSIEIPDSTTYIGYCAFQNCLGLIRVVIGANVTEIGVEAFEECYNLVEVWNYSSLDIKKGDGNYGCVALYAMNVITKNGTSKLVETDEGFIFYEDDDGSYLMGYCGTETVWKLPQKSPQGKEYGIYKYAFYGCTSLTSIEIPVGVTFIGESAFCNCGGLTSVIIGNSVASIGGSAFASCTSLETVILGNGVTSIGYYAFSGCSGLTSIAIPESVISIGDLAFYQCNGLTGELRIPDSVISIGSFAFSGCSGLTSVTIGDGVTKIGENAFSDCTNLKSGIIGNSVTEIGRRAFFGCINLMSIVFEDPNGWVAGSTKLSDLSNPVLAATNLRSYYYDNTWTRKD